jgi:hypothetical protein
VVNMHSFGHASVCACVRARGGGAWSHHTEKYALLQWSCTCWYSSFQMADSICTVSIADILRDTDFLDLEYLYISLSSIFC